MAISLDLLKIKDEGEDKQLEETTKLGYEGKEHIARP